MLHECLCETSKIGRKLRTTFFSPLAIPRRLPILFRVFFHVFLFRFLLFTFFLSGCTHRKKNRKKWVSFIFTSIFVLVWLFQRLCES